MLLRDRNLLLAFLLCPGLVLGEKDATATDRRSSFFARGRTQNPNPFVGGNSFNQPLRLVPRKPSPTIETTEATRPTTTQGSTNAPFEDLRRPQETERFQVEEAIPTAPKFAPIKKEPTLEARLRPEDELEDSIQGQVAEALVRESLSSSRVRTGLPTRPRGTKPTGIKSRFVRPVVRKPVVAAPQEVEQTRSEEVSDVNEEKTRHSSFPGGRRIVLPPRSAAARPQQLPQTRKTTSNLLPTLATSVRDKVDTEVETMLKKSSAFLRAKAPTDKMDKVDRELELARKNAENENRRLTAEIESLRAQLRQAQSSLEEKVESSRVENSERSRLEELLSLVEKETAQLKPSGRRAGSNKSRRPAQPKEDKTKVFRPGAFFKGRSDINVIPIRSSSPGPQAPRSNSRSRIEVDGVHVPKFSRMVKNAGLRLLAQDDRSVKAEEIAAPPRSRSRQQDTRSRGRKPTAPLAKFTSPESQVQGFRIKGDHTNRIIFLNVADLGLKSAGSSSLKLGNSELIPVEGLTGFGDSADAQKNSFDMKLGALGNMISTHSQTPVLDNRPASLPDYRNPLDVLRGVASRRPEAAIQQSFLPRASSNRFESLQRPEQQEQPRIRPKKQPIQFFNKFDDGKAKESPRSNNQLPRQSKSFETESRRPISSPSISSKGFGSFPARSGLDQLPSRPVSQERSLPSTQQNIPRRNDESRSLETVPQFTRFQQQAPRFSQQVVQRTQEPARLQPPQPRFQSQSLPLPQQLPRSQQQSNFQQTPRFGLQQQPQQQQAPRFGQQQTPQQQQQAPGIQEVLRQQAEVIALQQRQQLPQQQNFQQPQNFQQQQTFQQQPQNFQQPQNYQQQTQNYQQQQTQIVDQPQVPGLQEHQQQIQQHLATELQHGQPQQQQQQSQQYNPQPQQQYNPQPQQQYNPQPPQFNPQPQQFNQQPSQQQIPGLEQHSRFVAELQAAQNALG
eukprot:TRINITY_DN207_c0_g1_i9.p1 TRINITY_DN207_c0_g1~~TRINITY_DN207_c0_g1_i9.p1  ORF type:complete len:967 (-),score=290.80 TRINITY_DN207_c0_g1_i9:120-2987(-)